MRTRNNILRGAGRVLALLVVLAAATRAEDATFLCPHRYAPSQWEDYIQGPLVDGMYARTDILARIAAPGSMGVRYWSISGQEAPPATPDNNGMRVYEGDDGWNTPIGERGVRDGRLRYRDVWGDSTFTVGGSDCLWYDRDGDACYTPGVDLVLVGDPATVAPGSYGKTGGFYFHDENANGHWDLDEDIWWAAHRGFLTTAQNIVSVLRSMTPRFVNCTDHGGNWEGVPPLRGDLGMPYWETFAPNWTWDELLADAGGNWPDDVTAATLDQWIAGSAQLLDRMRWVKRISYESATVRERRSSATLASWAPENAYKDADGKWWGQYSWSVEHTTVAGTNSRVDTRTSPESPDSDPLPFWETAWQLAYGDWPSAQCFLWPQVPSQWYSMLGNRVEAICGIGCESIEAWCREIDIVPRIEIPSPYRAAVDHYLYLGPSISYGGAACPLSTLVPLEQWFIWETTPAATGVHQATPLGDPAFVPEEPPKDHWVDGAFLYGWEAFANSRAVCRFDVPGGLPPTSSPPTVPWPLTTAEALLNTVPDTNRDDIVEVGEDIDSFGPDTGTIAFEPERSPPQVLLPIFTRYWSDLRIHGYIAQGGFDTPRARWTHPDADENGLYQVFSLDTHVRIELIRVDDSHHIKRFEVIRPRGNAVTFEFDWDATTEEFKPWGRPTGINANRTYVLRDNTPDVVDDLDFDLEFESGLIHHFQYPGGLREIRHTDGRETRYLLGEPFTGNGADIAHNSFQTCRYVGKLVWQRGHIHQVTYTSRSGGGQVTSTLQYDANGWITGIQKSIPEFSVSVSGNTIAWGTGVTITRAGNTITLSRPDAGTYTETTLWSARELPTEQTREINGRSWTVHWDYYPDFGRYENGVPTWTKLKKTAWPDGYWERYEYATDTGWPVRIIAPFADATPTDPENQCRAIELRYDTLDPDRDEGPDPVHLTALPRLRIEYFQGQEVKREMMVTGISHAYLLDTVQQCTLPNVPWDSPSNLDWRIGHRKYCDTAEFASLRFNEEGILNAPQIPSLENGSVKVYSYHFGYTLSPDEPVENEWDIPYHRFDRDDWHVNGFGVADSLGSMVSDYDGTEWSYVRCGGWSGETGDFGRLVRKTWDDGRTVEYADYTSTAQPGRITGADGVESILTYSASGFLAQVRQPALGLTTDLEYDALGRLWKRTRTGTLGTGPATETVEQTFDPVGRLVEFRNGLGRTQCTWSGSTMTVTFPDGATQVVEFYRDRTLKSVSGTAVTPVHWEKGVGPAPGTAADPDRQRWWVVEKRPGPSGTFAASRRTFFDMLGRPTLVQTKDEAGNWANRTIAWKISGNTQEKTVTDALGHKTVSFEPILQRQWSGGLDADNDGSLGPNDPRSWHFQSQYAGMDFGSGSKGAIHSEYGSRASTASGRPPNEFVADLALDGLDATVVRNGRTTSLHKTFLPAPGSWTVSRDLPDGRTIVQEFARRLLASHKTYAADGTRVYFTSYEYDGLGRLTLVNQHQGGNTLSTAYEYDAAGRPVRITPPGRDPVEVVSFRAGTDWPTRVCFPGGAELNMQYEPNGLLKRRFIDSTHGVLPPGIQPWTMQFQYEPGGQLRQLITVRNGTDQTTEWVHSSYSGRTIAKEIGGHRIRGVEYLPTGDIARTVDTEGRTVEFLYDPTTGDLNSIRESMWPQDRGRRSGENAALGFWPDGWLKQTTSANGVVRHFTFNRDGQALVEDVQGAGVLPDHLISREFDPGHLGRTAFALALADPAHTDAFQTLQYSYDAASRLTGISTDGLSFRYEYVDGSAQVERESVLPGSSAGGGTVRDAPPLLVRDREWESGTGRLHKAKVEINGTETASWTLTYRQHSDRLELITRETGDSWFFDYDGYGQLSGASLVRADNSVDPALDFRYAFDSIGNWRRAGPTDPQTQQGTHAFAANDLNVYTVRAWNNTVEFWGNAPADSTVTTVFAGTRHSAERRDAGRFYFRFAVDNSTGPVPCEFRIRAVQTGARGPDRVAETTVQTVVPPQMETVDGDAVGNIVADAFFIYTWDARNQLRRIESRPTGTGPRLRLDFDYDIAGRRIRKQVFLHSVVAGTWRLTRTHAFLYDHDLPVFETVTDAAGVWLETRQYVWGLDVAGRETARLEDRAGGVGGLEAILITNTAGARQALLPVCDTRGNIVKLVNAAAGQVVAEYLYSPFGEVLGAIGPGADLCPFRFSTKYYDIETGFYWYGFRYYDPRCGKWLSPDPLGEAGGANLTAFVQNDPVNLIDPLGLYWGESIVEGVGKGLVWTGGRAWDGTKALGEGTAWTLNAAAWLAVGDKGSTAYGSGTGVQINGHPVEILFMNGVWNTEENVVRSRNALNTALGFPSSAAPVVSYVHNKTGLASVPKGLLWSPVRVANDALVGSWYDILQSGAEQLGMTDSTARFLGAHINSRLKANPRQLIILVAHSQGGAKLKQAFDCIDPSVRNRTFIITAAGAQVRGFPGASKAWRANKGGDLVSSPIGNASPQALFMRWLTGETANDREIKIQADHIWEKIPPFGLVNHGYETNYNADVAKVIKAILGTITAQNP